MVKEPDPLGQITLYRPFLGGRLANQQRPALGRQKIHCSDEAVETAREKAHAIAVSQLGLKGRRCHPAGVEAKGPNVACEKPKGSCELVGLETPGIGFRNVDLECDDPYPAIFAILAKDKAVDGANRKGN
jgi:hypothetical protein